MLQHPKVLIISLLITLTLFFSCLGINALNAKVQTQSPFRIGILVPMEHQALSDMVAGFKETVLQHARQPVEFIVQNAQGELALQNTIIQQFMGQKLDIIVPIGTTATQMTAHLVKKQAIVSLAALYSEEERLANKNHNITGVHDEIGPMKPLDMMQIVMPNLKKIALIHSQSERNYPIIAVLIPYAKKLGITVQDLTVQTLANLPTALHSIDSDAQAIFILKDHLIASGASSIVKTAAMRHIPFVAADEGSVKEGAAFCLGVKERTIGEQGGLLALKIMEGNPIKDMPMEDIHTLEIFYNPASLGAQNIKQAQLEIAAKTMGYRLSAVSLSDRG